MNVKKGFTLAEVLITLGIIGIVAALTIPVLINNYQKAQYVTGLKKAYTQFNQALMQLSSDYGCIGDLKCTGLFNTGTNQQSFGLAIVKYLKVMKDCGTNSGQGCWASSTNFNYDNSSSSVDHFDSTNRYKFINADGSSFWVENLVGTAPNCETNYSTGALGKASQVCGSLILDINGPVKGPNVYGRDTFAFWIINGNGSLLYPWGGVDDNGWGSNRWWRAPMTNVTRSCYQGNMSGHSCTGRIMEENWQMNY